MIECFDIFLHNEILVKEKFDCECEVYRMSEVNEATARVERLCGMGTNDTWKLSRLSKPETFRFTVTCNWSLEGR